MNNQEFPHYVSEDELFVAGFRKCRNPYIDNLYRMFFSDGQRMTVFQQTQESYPKYELFEQVREL